MKLNYSDFIAKHYDNVMEEDFTLSDLPDSAKDEAVYIWLMSHQTWLDDIFPASFGRGASKIALKMLYDKQPVASRLISDLFIAMAHDSPDDYGQDDLWWSHALEENLDKQVALPNFAEYLKDGIYLYVEDSVETAVREQFAIIDEEHRLEAKYG